jgi:MYXO-CTERM domain-containing protein
MPVYLRQGARGTSTWRILVATLVLVVGARQEGPPPEPVVHVGGLEWRWLAPRLPARGDEAWRPALDGAVRFASGGARLEVQRRGDGLRWLVSSEAGEVPPLRFRVRGVTGAWRRRDEALALATARGLVTERGLRAWQPLPDGSEKPLGARYGAVLAHAAAGEVEYAIELDGVDPSLPVVVDPDLLVQRFGEPGEDTVVALELTPTGETILGVQGSLGTTLRLIDASGVQVRDARLPSGVELVALAAEPAGLLVVGNTSVALPGETLIGGGDLDVYVARYPWDLRSPPSVVARLGTDGPDHAAAVAVRTTDGEGLPLAPTQPSIAITGNTEGRAGFPNLSTWGPLGEGDGFVVLLPADQSLWTTSGVMAVAGGDEGERLTAVTWSARDEAVAAGASLSTRLDPGLGVVQPLHAGAMDAWLVAVDDRGRPTWSTFLGGPGLDKATGISSGEKTITVTGIAGPGFPLHQPWSAWDAQEDFFLASLSLPGAALLLSTRWGGAADETTPALARIDDDRVYLTGHTASTSLKTWGAAQPELHGGSDAVFSVWSSLSGLPMWGTLLGGSEDEQGPVVPRHERNGPRFGLRTRSADMTATSGPTPDGSFDVALVTTKDPLPASLSLAVPGRNLLATQNACSPPVVLKADLAWANDAPRTLALGGVIETFSDPECREPTVATWVPKKGQQAHFFFRKTPVDPVTVSLSTPFGTAVPLAPALQLAATPLTIDGALATIVPSRPATVGAFTCLSLGAVGAEDFTLSAFDSAGQWIDGVLFGDETCGAPLGSSSKASFRAAPGIYTLQLAGNGARTTTTLVTVHDGNVPASVVVGPGSRRVVAGECSAPQHVVLTAPDGTPAAASVDTRVDLAGLGLEVAEDPACARPITSTTVAGGTAHSPPFYVRGGAMGLGAVFANGPGLSGDRAPYEVVPGKAPASVSLSATGSTVEQGSCSAPFIASTFDSEKNPSAEQRPSFVLRLGATGSGAVSFFADRRCTVPLAADQLAVPDGMWWAPFWVRGDAPGDVEITGLAGPLTDMVSVQVVVATGAATSMRFVTPPASVTAGACTALTVQPLDLGGTPVDEPGGASLRGSRPDVALFSDASCASPITALTGLVPAAGRTFYARATAAGVAQVFAGEAQVPTPATATVTVLSGPAASIVVSPSSVSVQRGACAAPVSVQLHDAWGNHASGDVAVSSTGAVPLAFGTTTCGTNGSLLLSFTGAGPREARVQGATVGAGVISLSSTGLTTRTVPVTVTAPPVVRWGFDPATALTVAAGACTPLLVKAYDADGLPTPSSGGTLLGATPGGPTFHLDGACAGGPVTTLAGPIPETGAPVYVRVEPAGDVELSVGGAPQVSGTRRLTVTPGAAARVTVTPASLAFTGRTCAGPLQVGLRDAWDNVLTAFTGRLTVSSSGTRPLRFATGPDCTGAADTLELDFAAVPSASFFVTGTTAGPAEATVGAGADGGLQAAVVTVDVGWPAAVALVVRPPPQQPLPTVAGACVTGLSLFAIDDGGVATRPLGGVQVTADTATAAAWEGASCGTAPVSTLAGPLTEDGIAFSLRETRAGQTQVAFSNGTLNTTLVLATDAGAPRLVVSPSPVVTPAKACLDGVTVRFEDEFQNPVGLDDVVSATALGDRGLVLAAGAGCVSAAPSISLLYVAQAERQLSLVAPRVGQAAIGFGAAVTGLDAGVVVTLLDAGNEAPAVTASPATLVFEELGDAGVVVVDAFDPDWDLLQWSWALDGGALVPTGPLQFVAGSLAPGTPLQLGGALQGTATFTPGSVLRDTPLEATVEVSDGLQTVRRVVNLLVRDTINEPPGATLVLDQPATTPVPSGTALRVVGTVDDPNGDPLTYEWTLASTDPGPVLNPASLEQLLVAPPAGPDGGVLRFSLVARDNRGGSSPPATLEVPVRADAQSAPVITSRARTLGHLERAWAYDDDSRATATSPSGAVVTWSLPIAPAGMTVASDTGVISWLPTVAGPHRVVLRATTIGGWAEEDFTVQVLASPKIVSVARATASLFTPWSYDDDNRPEALGAQPIGWSIAEGPPGMVVDQRTGAFTWLPLGTNPVRVRLVARNAFGEDEQDFTITVFDQGAPRIRDTANRNAQVGVGYVYDADNTVDVENAPADGVPVQLLAGPVGYRVTESGRVTWIPQAVGTFPVELVAGAGSQRSATLRYEVTVTEASSAPPTADARATPLTGPDAPLQVLLDGTGSRAGDGRVLVLHAWEAGDGRAPSFSPSSLVTYQRPGGYLARLDVADDLGSRATGQASIGVGLDGVLPPLARIVVGAREEPGAGQVAVSFSCDCSDPGGRPLQYQWLFGDGDQSFEAAPRHVYTRASVFRVRLLVSNGQLTTTVVEDLEVRSGALRPPIARAWADTVYGPAPLKVTFTSASADYDGVIAARAWDFGDESGAAADDVVRTFEAPGTYRATFTATDDDGLSSQDSVEVVVTTPGGAAPPVFTSLPTSRTATVGQPWSYDEDRRLAARGASRYGVGRSRGAQVVGAPEGLTVEEATGRVSWSPRGPGSITLVFWAENEAGRAWQELIVDVAPAASGCGCSSGGEAGLLLAVLLLVRQRRRR